LLPACDEFVGIDLSSKCIDACHQRFAGDKHAQFFVNDGHSLAAAQDDSFDLIFSFDSLVHAEHEVLASYVPQILRKLSPTEVAFLHHSNFLAYGNSIGNEHGRAMSVAADIVADLVARSGGTLLIQEVVNWGGEHLIDCLTLFTRQNATAFAAPVRLRNPLFMGEATLIQNFQSPYSAVTTSFPKAV
jgi:SAM-dependent methyltransferase